MPRRRRAMAARRSRACSSSTRTAAASCSSARSASARGNSTSRAWSPTPDLPAPLRCGIGSVTVRRSSAIDAVEIDVSLLKTEIKKTYASVSEEPEKDFIFPTGRGWAEDLDYPPELANVPECAVESFAGVANPFALGRLEAGERVLDLGSGAGTDSLVAAQMVGETGHVTGIDMTEPMLDKARAAAEEMGATNVEFVAGEVERLPFADDTF